jgi:hypothetical protein
MALELTPVDYMYWLLNTKNIKEHDAKTKVESMYYRQTGTKIKLFLKPFKGDLVWDYSYED